MNSRRGEGGCAWKVDGRWLGGAADAGCHYWTRLIRKEGQPAGLALGEERVSGIKVEGGWVDRQNKRAKGCREEGASHVHTIARKHTCTCIHTHANTHANTHAIYTHHNAHVHQYTHIHTHTHTHTPAASAARANRRCSAEPDEFVMRSSKLRAAGVDGDSTCAKGTGIWIFASLSTWRTGDGSEQGVQRRWLSFQLYRDGTHLI